MYKIPSTEYRVSNLTDLRKHVNVDLKFYLNSNYQNDCFFNKK